LGTQVKRPTGRKRLKRAQEEGQDMHRDADEMQRELFGNEGVCSQRGLGRSCWFH